jgi:hypothetical protein
MSMTSDRFKEALHKLIIMDSQTEKAVDEVNDFMAIAGLGTEARIGNIRGPSRVGKTAIVRKLKSMHMDSCIDGRRNFPILYIKIEGHPTIKNVLAATLGAMGVSVLPRDSGPRLMELLDHYLKRCGVRLIVFDEFQHFLKVRGSSRTGVFDTIKTILNKCRCPILAVGINTSMDVIMADPQLSGRCIYKRELKIFNGPSNKQSAPRPSDRDVGPSYNEYMNAVVRFFRLADLKLAPGLRIEDLCAEMHSGSAGRYGRTTDIIVTVLQKLEKNGSREVTLDLVRTVMGRMPKMETMDEANAIDEIIRGMDVVNGRPKRHGYSRLVARAEEMTRTHRAE